MVAGDTNTGRLVATNKIATTSSKFKEIGYRIIGFRYIFNRISRIDKYDLVRSYYLTSRQGQPCMHAHIFRFHQCIHVSQQLFC